MALDEKTTAEEGLTHEKYKLAAQLRESNRRLDLNRLRDAQAAWEKDLVQLAREKLGEIAPENRCVVWGILNRRFEGGSLTLHGHSQVVCGVAFSPDDTRIVTASLDQTIRVWDAATGLCVRELKGHTAGVTSVSFSPDSQRFVSGSSDSTSRVWDATTGKCLLELRGHTAGLTSVAFSPDGKRIVTGCGDLFKPGDARVWDATTGKCLLELRGHTGSVESVAFSPDGKRIVTGSEEGTAWVWDAATGRRLLSLQDHGDSVTSVGFSPDGTRIVTGSKNQKVCLWNATLGYLIMTLDGSKQLNAAKRQIHVRETKVCLSPDGTRAITTALDDTAKVWDLTTRECRFQLKGHSSSVTCVGSSSDGRRIVTGSADNTARVWDADDCPKTLKFNQQPSPISSVGFSVDGRRITAGSSRAAAWVWDAVTGQTLQQFAGEDLGESVIAFSPHADRALVASHTVFRGGDIKKYHSEQRTTSGVWDISRGPQSFELTAQMGSIGDACFSPDGRWLLTASSGVARVWDVTTRQLLLELKGYAVALSPGVGQSIKPGPGLGEQRVSITSVAFSPNGRHVVTGANDGVVRVWDMPTGKMRLELKGHFLSVTSVRVSACGRWIATGASDGTAMIWDMTTGDLTQKLRGHTRAVTSAVFNPDSKRIVTGSRDNTARVWDVATGQLLLELKGHTGSVSVALSPDGQQIITGSSDATVRVWEASFDLFPSEAAGVIKPSEAELARRRWWAQADPVRHGRLAEQYKADPFAAAVHRSLEQQARGRIAVEDLDFDKAQKHFLAAMLLKPKPYQWPEVAPPPRLVK